MCSFTSRAMLVVGCIASLYSMDGPLFAIAKKHAKPNAKSSEVPTETPNNVQGTIPVDFLSKLKDVAAKITGNKDATLPESVRAVFDTTGMSDKTAEDTEAKENGKKTKKEKEDKKETHKKSQTKKEKKKDKSETDEKDNETDEKVVGLLPLGEDACRQWQKCDECGGSSGMVCNWCAGDVVVFNTTSKNMLELPSFFPGVCTASNCDSLTFGTLNEIYDGWEIPDSTVNYSVQPASDFTCERLSNEKIEKSQPDVESALQYADCNTCVQNIPKGASGWCKYDTQFTFGVREKIVTTSSGGICADCLTQDHMVRLGIEANMTTIKDTKECPTSDEEEL